MTKEIKTPPDWPENPWSGHPGLQKYRVVWDKASQTILQWLMDRGIKLNAVCDGTCNDCDGCDDSEMEFERTWK